MIQTKSQASAGIHFSGCPFHFTLHPIGLVRGVLTGFPLEVFGKRGFEIVDSHLAGVARAVAAASGVDEFAALVENKEMGSLQTSIGRAPHPAFSSRR